MLKNSVLKFCSAIAVLTGGAFVGAISVSDSRASTTSTPQNIKVAQTTTPRYQVGGSYIIIRTNYKNKGGQAHHIPPKSTYCGEIDLQTNDGPSIWMEPADHRKLQSTGGGPGSANDKYRQTLAALIKQGKYKEAMDKEIADIKDKFPAGEYDKAIVQALAYYETVKKKTVPRSQTCDITQTLEPGDD
jgi:hypothetical protein